MKRPDSRPRTTVSLHPLSLRDAVKGLLETKPDSGKGQGREQPQKPQKSHQGDEERDKE